MRSAMRMRYVFFKVHFRRSSLLSAGMRFFVAPHAGGTFALVLACVPPEKVYLPGPWTGVVPPSHSVQINHNT